VTEQEQIVTEDKNALVDIARQLREAREAKSLTRSEVAHNLHLDESVIIILESGDFTKLTGLTYVVGYIRNYAKLLKLPVETILGQLIESNVNNQAIVPTYLQGETIKFNTGTSGKKITLIILSVLIVLVITWWVVKNIDVLEVFNLSQINNYPLATNNHHKLI